MTFSVPIDELREMDVSNDETSQCKANEEKKKLE